MKPAAFSKMSKMEEKVLNQKRKAIRKIIARRQKARTGKSQYSVYSIILIIIVFITIIISCSSASTSSQRFSANRYFRDSGDSLRRFEHGRRHGHKFSPSIDYLSSLKSSKNIMTNFGEDSPSMPFDSSDTKDSLCPTCVFDKNSDKLRLEAIKRQILSKLGLQEKPTVTLPVPREVVLETLTRADSENSINGREEKAHKDKEPEVEDEVLESEPDDFFGRTSEIITFAEPGHPLNGQTLLEFGHSSESDPGVIISQLKVKSALLWVRVALIRSAGNHHLTNKKNMTLWVFKVKPTVANITFLSGKDFDEHTELVGSLSVSLLNLGWQKIDMSDAVKEWYEDNLSKEKLRLLVDCSGCKDVVQVLLFRGHRLLRNPNSFGGRRVRSAESKTSNGNYRARMEEELNGDLHNISSHGEKLDPNRPFLVVHTEPVVMKRSRRRAWDCSGAVRGQCCKQNFFVDFKDLKWDDWIIAPRGYHANYCKGDCGGIFRTPDTYLNYHTHVMEEYQKLDRLSGIEPCCAPVKFSGISVIYFDTNSNIIKRDLPKMVVEQCGCP